MDLKEAHSVSGLIEEWESMDQKYHPQFIPDFQMNHQVHLVHQAQVQALPALHPPLTIPIGHTAQNHLKERKGENTRKVTQTRRRRKGRRRRRRERGEKS